MFDIILVVIISVVVLTFIWANQGNDDWPSNNPNIEPNI